MPITSSAFGNDSGSSTTTVSTGSGLGTVQNLNAVAGQPIIGAYECANGGTITGIADTIGNSYTVLTPETTFGPTTVIFYCTSSIGSNASNVITATVSAATTFKAIAAVTGTGFDTAALFLDQKTNAANGASISPSAALNCGTSDAMLLFGCIASNDREFDTASGSVEVYDAFTSAFSSRGGSTQYKFTTGGGSQSVTVSVTGGVASNLEIAVAAFKLLPAQPSVTKNPSSTNVVVGQTAAFSVEGTSSNGALSYQWQDNSSGSFADIVGATSSTYTTAATTSSFQRRQYRCGLTNLGGTVYSSAASLTLTFNDVYLYSMPEFADPDDVDLRDPTVFTSGGGGTTYNDSVAETLAGVDTITATTTFAAVIAETGAAADTITAVANFAAAIAETGTAADTVTVSAVFNSIVAETAAAVDTVTAAAVTAAAIAETGSAADTVSAVATLNGVIAETLAAVDSTDALLVFIAQVNEALSGADTVTASALFNAVIAETLAAVDTVTVSANFNAAISETLNAVDTTDATITGAGGTTYNDSVSETLSAVDTVSASANFAGAIAETLSATDSIDALLTQLGAIAETLAATETVNGLISATAAISETGAAADTVTSLLVTTASVQEVASAIETITTQTNFNATIVEVMNAFDSTDATGGTAPTTTGHAYWLIFKRRTRR